MRNNSSDSIIINTCCICSHVLEVIKSIAPFVHAVLVLMSLAGHTYVTPQRKTQDRPFWTLGLNCDWPIRGVDIDC